MEIPRQSLESTRPNKPFLKNITRVAVGITASWIISLTPSLALAQGTKNDTKSPTTKTLALEKKIFELVNQDRKANHLLPFREGLRTLPIARKRAENQIGLDNLTHFGPNGLLFFVQLLDSNGIPYSFAGENLGRVAANSDAAERLEAAWMKSPTHRQNLLDPQFETLAVGAVEDQGYYDIAQIFRRYPVESHRLPQI